MAKLHDGHVCDDDGVDACIFGFGEDLFRSVEFVVIDDGVECEVAFDIGIFDARHDFGDVIDIEGAAGNGTHVEVADTEVDGICACVNGCGE